MQSVSIAQNKVIKGGTFQQTEILLNAPLTSESLQPHIQFYIDPTRNLKIEQVAADDFAGRFDNVKTATPDFGYIKSGIWLKIELKNVGTDNSDWRLFFRENFMQQFAVFKVAENKPIETLIFQNELSTFDSRPIGFSELVAPLKLAPNEKAKIFVRYESGGSSEISFSIETIESFESLTSRRTAKNFIYYGMVTLLCIIALLAFVATRQVPFVAYTFYALGALMFIVHSDGNGFKYLWSDFPLFNAFGTIFFGAWLGIACCIFARIFLKTKQYHPIIDKALIGMIAVTLAIFVSTLFLDHQQIKRIMILTSLMSIILGTGAGFVAARTRFKEVRFYVLAWTGVLISASVMTGRHWLGLEISEELQFDSMRIVLVIDATMMGLAIWDSLNQGRKAQHLALKSSLQSTERTLKLSTRLHDLEQKYEAAMSLSQSKDNKLVSTLHDLRQPLHALRLNVNNMASIGSDGLDTKSVEQTFDYLEDLVSEHFSNAGSMDSDRQIASSANAVGANFLNKDDSIERIKFDDILQSIHEMFLPDAKEKGLAFHFVKSSKDTNANALVMMRMISNLVSNSIKYTNKGKILLGVRKVGETMRIEIHDTGSGMTRDQFEIAKQRNTRLDKNESDASGSGHGLAIVEELTKVNGYEFDMLCERKSGLSLGIRVPIIQ